MAEPTHSDLHRAIGALEARTGIIESNVAETRADVKVLLAAEERRKGERGVIAVLATAGGSIGTLVVSKLFPKLFG